MTERASHLFLLFLLIFLALLGSAVFMGKTVHRESSCFLTVPVNASGVKPPIVSGPGFPPEAGFKGMTLNEVVNRSPRHVLLGFFNFKSYNWTEKKPKCYFKALEGFSENWTGFILSGTSFSNVTLSGRVYLALYVYPKETSIIISKVEYGETPEESKIVEAFQLRYHESPKEYVERYLGQLRGEDYTKTEALPEGVVLENGDNALLVLKIEDDANVYTLVVRGSRNDVLKIAGREVNS